MLQHLAMWAHGLSSGERDLMVKPLWVTRATPVLAYDTLTHTHSPLTRLHGDSQAPEFPAEPCYLGPLLGPTLQRPGESHGGARQRREVRAPERTGRTRSAQQQRSGERHSTALAAPPRAPPYLGRRGGEQLLPLLAMVLQAPLPVLCPAGLRRGQPPQEALPVLGPGCWVLSLGGLGDKKPAVHSLFPPA